MAWGAWQRLRWDQGTKMTSALALGNVTHQEGRDSLKKAFADGDIMQTYLARLSFFPFIISRSTPWMSCLHIRR